MNAIVQPTFGKFRQVPTAEVVVRLQKDLSQSRRTAAMDRFSEHLERRAAYNSRRVVPIVELVESVEFLRAQGQECNDVRRRQLT